MNEKDITQDQYIKGFNEGYTLAQYEPELAETLSKAVGELSRSEGFKEGWKQFQLEKSKEKLPQWMSDKKQKSKDKDTKSKDLEKDKD